MGLIHRRLIAATCVCLLSACASAPPQESAPHADHASIAAPNSTLAQWAQGAQRLHGLGTYSRKVTTNSPEAQAWFDQGLNLVYGFNHDEAVRSFAKAVEIDPACAMCYWGAAAALGPNYNMPAMEQRWQVLWNAIQSAQQHAADGTPVEQALIAALGKRYAGPAPVPADKMQPFNDAYASAMRDVAKQYPADDDVQVF